MQINYKTQFLWSYSLLILFLLPSIIFISLKTFCLSVWELEIKLKRQPWLVRDLVHCLPEACHEVYETCLSKGRDPCDLLSLGSFLRLLAFSDQEARLDNFKN